MNLNEIWLDSNCAVFWVFFLIVYYLPVLSSPTPNLETEIRGIMIRSWTALMKIKS